MAKDNQTTRARTGLWRILALTPAALLAFGSGGNAYAQADVEEIIVTATKRASTIQDVPFSINVQTQKDIRRSGATDLEELSRNVAGLTVQNLGPGEGRDSQRDGNDEYEHPGNATW